MKPITLTILLLCSVVWGKAQVKVDTTKFVLRNDWSSLRSTSSSTPVVGLTLTSSSMESHPYYFKAYQRENIIISISAPDSNKMIIVRLNPKLVKFINV